MRSRSILISLLLAPLQNELSTVYLRQKVNYTRADINSTLNPKIYQYEVGRESSAFPAFLTCYRREVRQGRDPNGTRWGIFWLRIVAEVYPFLVGTVLYRRSVGVSLDYYLVGYGNMRLCSR
jgi:hypothetical protein